MSDYIKIQETIDRLSEVLSSEAEFEKAKEVIIEAPTISETEIIRKPFERVLERLEELKVNAFNDESVIISDAIEILKEECGISE